MPLSKKRMADRKRKDRSVVKPKSNLTPNGPADNKTFGYATKDVPKPKWMELT